MTTTPGRNPGEVGAFGPAWIRMSSSRKVQPNPTNKSPLPPPPKNLNSSYPPKQQLIKPSQATPNTAPTAPTSPGAPTPPPNAASNTCTPPSPSTPSAASPPSSKPPSIARGSISHRTRSRTRLIRRGSRPWRREPGMGFGAYRIMSFGMWIRRRRRGI